MVHPGPALLDGGETIGARAWREAQQDLHAVVRKTAIAPPPTGEDAEERNFVKGAVTKIQGYGDRAVRPIPAPDSPSEMDGLRDGSLDRSGAKTDDLGEGRFESGRITLGHGDQSTTHYVEGDGREYVDGSFPLFFVLERSHALSAERSSLGRSASSRTRTRWGVARK